MAYINFRSSLSALAFVGVAFAPGAAGAGDLAATPEGAKQIVEFFKTYVGANAATEPALVVKSVGDAYLVAFDITALAVPLKPLGIDYEAATVTFKVFQQDNGVWRVEATNTPPMVAHQTTARGVVDSAFTFSGFKSVYTIDPALGWARYVQMSADKFSMLLHGPGVNESFDLAPIEASSTAESGADGTIKTSVHETLGAFDFNLQVDPKYVEPHSITEAKSVFVTGGAQSGDVDFVIDGLKTKPLLDAWAFTVAHLTPADAIANEAALKSLLTALAATQPSISESGAFKGLTFNAPQGVIAVADGQFSVSLRAAGPASHIEEHLVANGLSLPETLAPQMVRDLVPTTFDIAFKVTGIDVNAAANEAIADMHATDEGLTLSQDDKSRVFAKLIGAGPLVVDIPPSRIVAPRLDIDFEGRLLFPKGGRPSATFAVHMRDFDKTVAAMNGLGAKAQQDLVPALAMAKGLAKAGPDGALSWVGELGEDGMMKVNGMPLGKAPL